MKPSRVHNPLVLAALLDGNAPKELVSDKVTPAQWLACPDNIALRIGTDLAMFEGLAPGIYAGHVWFESRGAEALKRGRQIIAEMFSRYAAKTIGGETPAGNRSAILFARKLGFKSAGEAVRDRIGPVVLSVLSA